MTTETADLAEPARKMRSVEEAVHDSRFGYHVYLRDGIAYTPDVTDEIAATIENFPIGERDVIAAGYPKSGTNWLTITLSRLYPGWETTKVSGAGRAPSLDVPSRPAIGFEGLDECLAAPSPRLMKCHSPLQHMPAAFRDRGIGRAIYITRNPKDVCDSYFGQLQPWLPPEWTWDKHVDAFIEGHIFFGSWLDNVRGWHKRDEVSGVLHLGFEEMKRDRRAAIERIVAFVGPVADGAIDRVVAETDFRAMQEGELRTHYQPQMIRREGKAGGWKRRFTVEQSERIDAAFAAALEAAGIDIDYGR